jgi:Na+/glutamate symporter
MISCLAGWREAALASGVTGFGLGFTVVFMAKMTAEFAVPHGKSLKRANLGWCTGGRAQHWN